MGKKAKLDELILKNLKKGALKVPEIKKCIKDSEEWNSLDNPKKTFKESLVRLLTKKKIYIDGYESDNESSRSFNFNCLFFSSSDTVLSPIEIENLIYKGFFSEKPDMESIKCIKGLFSGKIKKLILKWNETQKSVHIDVLTPKVALWLEAERLLIKNLKEEPVEITKEEYESILRFYMDEGIENIKKSIENPNKPPKNKFIKPELKSKERKTKFIEPEVKYSHYRVRFLDGELIDNLIPLDNPNRSRRFKIYHLVKDPELTDAEFLDKEIEVQGLKGKSDEEIEAYFVFDWPVSDEQFLEWKLGFSRPYEGDWHMKELFNQVIKYLKLRESDKKGFISKLAYALSDDDESNKFLIGIIDEVKKS